MKKLEIKRITNRLGKEKGLNNPIDNFRPNFVKDLEGISSLQLGQSIPHISISSLDLKRKCYTRL